jgi:hypothetical protein
VKDRKVRRETKTFSEFIVFQPRQDTSDEILFLFDRFISSDHVDFCLYVTDAFITWACEAKYLNFQLWIKAVFWVASAAIICFVVGVNP